jgi:hypothetical protein
MTSNQGNKISVQKGGNYYNHIEELKKNLENLKINENEVLIIKILNFLNSVRELNDFQSHIQSNSNKDFISYAKILIIFDFKNKRENLFSHEDIINLYSHLFLSFLKIIWRELFKFKNNSNSNQKKEKYLELYEFLAFITYSMNIELENGIELCWFPILKKIFHLTSLDKFEKIFNMDNEINMIEFILYPEFFNLRMKVLEYLIELILQTEYMRGFYKEMQIEIISLEKKIEKINIKGKPEINSQNEKHEKRYNQIIDSKPTVIYRDNFIIVYVYFV